MIGFDDDDEGIHYATPVSAADAINALAEDFVWIGPTAYQKASKIWAEVERIHGAFGDVLFPHIHVDTIAAFYPERFPDRHGTNYPWHRLKKVGDKFVWPFPSREGGSVKSFRNVLRASAHNEFGSGIVRVKDTPNGFLVLRVA